MACRSGVAPWGTDAHGYSHARLYLSEAPRRATTAEFAFTESRAPARSAGCARRVRRGRRLPGARIGSYAEAFNVVSVDRDEPARPSSRPSRKSTNADRALTVTKRLTRHQLTAIIQSS